MIRKCRLLFVFIFLSAIPFAIFAQNDSTFLKHTITKLEQQPVSEKVYLHLDKPNYSFGDTIWFKAYTVVGSHHQLSALSGILYVELISPKDSLITRQTMPLLAGLAWSDIPLAKTLKQGSYRIRAYTNWMRNANPDYFYNQKILIGGIAPNSLKQTVVKTPDVQFFPEGGQLVNGVRSRVAIKSVGTNGLGEDITGTITDNEGNVVADFATQHLGMGVFALIPQSGKTYTAKINVPGENAFTVPLPKAAEEGYTLALNNSQKDSIYIKMAVNDKVLNDQKNNNFYIIGQNNDKVYYTSAGKLESLVYTAKVEKKRFPTGISQFTLFSQNGEPLAERIAFIQNDDTLKLNISTSAQNYTARQKVKIDLNTSDDNNKPVTGSFSVAVIDESKVATDENEESTIINDLLLTSDLKGYIEQPNYYFTTNNEKNKADLDILMLTQGYRRFEWKQVLNDTKPVITYQPERSLELAGTLKTSSGAPAANGKVTLVATKANLLRDTTADGDGNFKFADLPLIDTSILVLRARKDNNGSNVKIEVHQTDYLLIEKTNKTDTLISYLSTQSIAILQQKYSDYQQAQKQDYLKNGIRLKNVTIQGYKRPKEPDLSNSASLHPGEADQVIMGDKLGDCGSLADCLTGQIRGVIIKPRGSSIDGSAVAVNTRGGVMSVIVDGMIMPSSYLGEINTNEVYSIEVLRSTHAKLIYGSSIEGGGALVITLRRGEVNSNLNQIAPQGLISFLYTGFYKSKAFYSPKYTHAKTESEAFDLRSTIYWNPNIITDKDGKASFEYFNADTRGSYRVVVEGIDDNGNLGRRVYRYKVE